MKRLHLFLPEQQIAALKKKSEQTGISVAELIRRAIDQFNV